MPKGFSTTTLTLGFKHRNLDIATRSAWGQEGAGDGSLGPSENHDTYLRPDPPGPPRSPGVDKEKSLCLRISNSFAQVLGPVAPLAPN